MVPCHRQLLPLCFERRTDGLQLHCGNEQSIEGELVAVVDGDKLGAACVVVGSFCNAEISVFGLLPPHRWLPTSCKTTRTTCGSEGEWRKLFSVDLSPTAPMRLSGLAVWGGLGELEAHCLISERSEPGPGASIARELWHKSRRLAEHFIASQDEEDCQTEAKVYGPEQSQVFQRLADDVAGIRQEMKGLRECLVEFTHDFKRMVAAVETLARR